MTEVFLGMMSFVLLAASVGLGLWMGRRYERALWQQKLEAERQAALRRMQIPEGMTAEQVRAEREALKAEQDAYRAMMNYSAEEAYRNASLPSTRGDI